MMKQLFFCLFLLLNYCAASQNSLVISQIKEDTLKADKFIGVDDFNYRYFIKNGALVKTRDTMNWQFSNFKLTQPWQIDILNPLEILIFYSDFNTISLLDNTLNNILEIDFNHPDIFRNVSFASLGIDRHFWLFNTDDQQLELFNYQNNTFFKIGQSFDETVIDITSNYNFCWVLTSTRIYKYNSYGGLLMTMRADDFESIGQSRGDLILSRDGGLFYLPENESTIIPLKLPNIKVKEFYLNDENLYIYDSEVLYLFQLQNTKNN